MATTYTYTARSADDPSHMATFTLYQERMTIDVGGAFEQIERTIQARAQSAKSQNGSDANGKASSSPLVVPPWVKPAAIRLAQQGAKPFSITDVVVVASDGGTLNVRTWVRVGGLRLAPLNFHWNEVDNPDAALAFATELARRQKAVIQPGPFTGLLDYWVTWIVAVLGVSIVVANQLSGSSDDSA